MKVQVLFPAHAGSAPATPADGVMARPQLSVTDGGVGNTASEGHATVALPPAGNTTVGALIVYVYTYVKVEASHLVYVNVQVFVPAQGGSAEGTPADGTSMLPQLSTTSGAIGATANAGHATVDDDGAGGVTMGGVML